MYLILLAFMDVGDNLTKIILALVGLWHVAMTVKHGREIKQAKKSLDEKEQGK